MKTNFEKEYLLKTSRAEKEFSAALEQYHVAEMKYCQVMKGFIREHIANTEDEFSELYKKHKSLEADYVNDEPYDFIKEYRIYDVIVNWHIADIERGDRNDIDSLQNIEAGGL